MKFKLTTINETQDRVYLQRFLPYFKQKQKQNFNSDFWGLKFNDFLQKY